MKKFSEEHKNKLSKSIKESYIKNPLLRKFRSDKMKKLRNEGKIQAWNKGSKGLIIAWNKGLTKETDKRVEEYAKNKIGIRRLDLTKRNLTNNPMKNLDSRKKAGIKISGKWRDKSSIFNSKEFREKHLRSTLKSLIKRPTSFEQKIILLCSKHKLPFIYTGDGRIIVGYKNPDFINEKDKVIMEVFLNYFKIRDFGSVENYVRKRTEYFDKYGYKTIFIREEEITNKDWENICLNKINKFRQLNEPIIVG